MADETDTTIEEGLQPLTLSIDWDLFGSYLDDSDLSEDQKREFIESLWSIVVGFVDLGFGIAPTQLACEQNAHSALRLPQDLLSLDQDIPNRTASINADETPTHPAEREES